MNILERKHNDVTYLAADGLEAVGGVDSVRLLAIE